MLKRFWTKLRTFLYYNRVERKGVLTLAFVLFTFFSCLYVYEHFNEKKLDSAAFFATVDSIENISKPKIAVAKSYFAFNPNIVDSATLQQLGFSSRQIRNLQNYRKAGGHFRTKEDFKKLYFVNDSIYKIYEPYLTTPKETKTTVNHYKKSTGDKTMMVKRNVDSLFIFNPNTITKVQWLRLGVREKIVTIIGNYLAKGGHFYKKEDLKKIYGFSEQTYERLAPYIVIPQKEKEESIVLVYDLNKVTIQELEKLGVSKAIAQRVVKYREKLGGYAEMKQLLEVYNTNEYNLKLLQKHCKIQTGVQQINVNNAQTSDLSKHPYLSFRDAEAIVRYRKRKGAYENIKVLKSRKILTGKVFEKVKKYLKVKNKEGKIGK